MPALVTNNGVSALASGITNVATSLSVTSTEGALFPNPTGIEYFMCTLVDSSNNIEIIKVTARSGDTFSTIVRAQDGTSARAYSTADVVSLRPTAALFDSKADLDGAAFTGDISTTGNAQVDGTLDVDGNTTLGNASGDTVVLTGNTISAPNDMTVSGTWDFSTQPEYAGDQLQTEAEVIAEVTNQLGGVTSVPTGGILFWSHTTVPAGYLECDGSEVSQATYSDLYAAVGADAFGTDAGGNFFLPDAGGRVPVGRDGSYPLAQTGGATSSNYNLPLKDHTHNTIVVSASEVSTVLSATYKYFRSRADTNTPGDNYKYTIGGATSGTPTAGLTSTAGEGASHSINVNKFQPYISLVMMIKT